MFIVVLGQGGVVVIYVIFDVWIVVFVVVFGNVVLGMQYQCLVFVVQVDVEYDLVLVV